MKGKRLRTGSRVMSKWQYNNDSEPRWGILPEGWDGEGTALIQWDDDGSQEWEDRTSFIYTPSLGEALSSK